MSMPRPVAAGPRPARVTRKVAVGDDVLFTVLENGEATVYPAKIVRVITKRPLKPGEAAHDDACMVHLLVALTYGWAPIRNAECSGGSAYRLQAVDKWSWPAASIPS